MPVGKRNGSWPEQNDRYVVAEMITDPHSQHWTKCRDFVAQAVAVQAKNLPRDFWDDVIQDTMLSVKRSLPTFRMECSFKTWLYSIAKHRIQDTYRIQVHNNFYLSEGQNGFSELLDDKDAEGEINGDAIAGSDLDIPENATLLSEALQEALAALKEFIDVHAQPARNRQILEAILLEGYTHTEAAKMVGTSPAVASYVVRSAQRYIRERLATDTGRKCEQMNAYGSNRYIQQARDCIEAPYRPALSAHPLRRKVR